MEGETHTPDQAKGKVATSIYLFCLARCDSLPPIEGLGLDGTGLPFQATFRDVVAVLSEVNAEEWIGTSGERNLHDLHWVGPRACRHEEIIEQVMHFSPVFPARFGTLFSSLQTLESLLAAHYDTIADFLAYIGDKDEWGVKLLLDKAKAQEHLFATKQRPLPAAPGARYLLEQRFRAEAGREAKSWARKVGSNVAQALRAQAVDFRPLKVVAHKDQEQEVLFNRAFLLSKDAIEPFLGHLRTLNAEYAERGVSLKASGPWPPYNFCPILSKG